MKAKLLAVAAVAAGVLTIAPAAQAGDSAGAFVAGAITGVVVGSVFGPPVVYAPPPVVYYPPPAAYYPPPAVVYRPPAVAYYPPPRVYYAPPVFVHRPYAAYRGHAGGWGPPSGHWKADRYYGHGGRGRAYRY